MNKGDIFTIDYIVDEGVYQGFIGIFGDKNPLHTNVKLAVSKGFKGCVMHGNILNGFISHFIGECLPVKDVIIHSQEINFNSPVYLNDRLVFTAQIAEVYESVNVLEFKFSFKNLEDKKVAKGKIRIGLT